MSKRKQVIEIIALLIDIVIATRAKRRKKKDEG